MNKQPEALRLADALDSRRESSPTHYINEAADEMRRLYAENKALNDALQYSMGRHREMSELAVRQRARLDELERLQPKRELTDDEARRIYNEATYHASIAVFMTRMDAEHQDADDKGVSGWLQEAEDRVKHRIIERKPLTNECIYEISEDLKWYDGDCDRYDIYGIARAIEAAHNIK